MRELVFVLGRRLLVDKPVEREAETDSGRAAVRGEGIGTCVARLARRDWEEVAVWEAEGGDRCEPRREEERVVSFMRSTERRAILCAPLGAGKPVCDCC